MTEPTIISTDNLSLAWGRALLHMFENRTTIIRPLVISLTGFDEDSSPNESPEIRGLLDRYLVANNGMYPVGISAMTIFPQGFWLMANGDRQEFYRICSDAIPRLKAANRLNRHGMYFERLMFFGRGASNGNQLEFIIQNHAPGRRFSHYQASIFDPERDHNRTARLGFPCLQHVSFVPTENGIELNAFYATQLLIERAYGNLLGLSHLGAFMAEHLGTSLKQVNMFVGRERLQPNKGSLNEIKQAVEDILGA